MHLNFAQGAKRKLRTVKSEVIRGRDASAASGDRPAGADCKSFKVIKKYKLPSNSLSSPVRIFIGG